MTKDASRKKGSGGGAAPSTAPGRRTRFDKAQRHRLGLDGKSLFRHAVSHEVVQDECRSVEAVSNITARDLESMGSELESFDEWKGPLEDKARGGGGTGLSVGDGSVRAAIAMKRRAQNTFMYT
ncbi:Aste57867_16607 [Aphanomyces stellatus]|uniref:Aste57867_16607 protein n=1 Tax=Aphanomyces stellatus TaxID=120398 RepID=A0A485L6P7_9STRA|nr:hypothetical protein As57867_016550 [Aphanomyces stellatus]VFT93378.1 Aste57867_16607 [Aphanomyces stellatus]